LYNVQNISIRELFHTSEDFIVKKRKIILHILLLIIAAASFFLFRAYIRVSTDSKPPVFSVGKEMLELSVSDPESALLQDISAKDARDGDVTHTILVESVTAINDENIATVTYAAFDRSGNIAKTQRKVHYTDYHAPRITLTHPACFVGETGADLMSYVGAEDLLEGDIGRRVRATLVSNTGSLTKEGTHTVRLAVSNSLGDSVQLEIPIEIYPVGLYNAQLELEEYIIYLPKGSAFRPEDYLDSFVYGNKSISLARNHPMDFFVKYGNTVQTSVPGVYSVSYTATYTDRNAQYTGHSVLIVVIEE
jgi:hypothetical protein